MTASSRGWAGENAGKRGVAEPRWRWVPGEETLFAEVFPGCLGSHEPFAQFEECSRDRRAH